MMTIWWLASRLWWQYEDQQKDYEWHYDDQQAHESDLHIITDCWGKGDVNGHNNDSSNYEKAFIDDAEAHKVPLNGEN